MNGGLLDGELLLTLNSCHVQGNFRWCMLSYSERCKKNLLLLNFLPIPTVQTESLSLVLDVFNAFLALIYLLCNREQASGSEPPQETICSWNSMKLF